MIALVIILLIAASHLGFGLVEMFGKPSLQANAFGFEEAELKSKTLQTALSNQGVYNIGFGILLIVLACLRANRVIMASALGFVVLVGLYGGLTVTKKIFLVQMTPALVGIVLIFWGYK